MEERHHAVARRRHADTRYNGRVMAQSSAAASPSLPARNDAELPVCRLSRHLRGQRVGSARW